jgi:hypothetical protein
VNNKERILIIVAVLSLLFAGLDALVGLYSVSHQSSEPTSTTEKQSLNNAQEPTIKAEKTTTESLSDAVKSHEAINFIGESKVVCGYVAQIKSIQGRTYLNLGSSYPHQDIAIVIWPDDADKVSSVLSYGGKELCIKGEITTYKDTPQISLKNPSQIVN